MTTAFVAGQTNHVALFNQLGTKNVVINGGFTVNQRVYVSAAVLASGSYGHDRWKAGAGGGDYSFTQLAHNTTITIAANKTLIQVVEDKNVVGGQYVLSWTGTCQARYGLNSATPSGSYASSPIVITGQTAGTTMSIEFGNGASAGTLGTVQLEVGTADPTDFEKRTFQQELALCQRYYWKSFPYATAPAQATGGQVGAIGYLVRLAGINYDSAGVIFPVVMRATPTVTFYNPSAANAKWRNFNVPADSSTSAAATFYASDRGFMAQNQQVAGDALSHSIGIHATAEIEL